LTLSNAFILNRNKNKMDIKKLNGYVIVRMMLNELNELKPYTYYPTKEHGKPPFFFKNKNNAIKKLNSKSMDFYKFGNELKVLKFKPYMYLDRY